MFHKQFAFEMLCCICSDDGRSSNTYQWFHKVI